MRQQLSVWVRPLFSVGPFSLTEVNPLQTGVDRAFGALADSVGLTAPRGAIDDMRGFTEAQLAWTLAASKYLGIAGDAAARAAWSTITRLRELRAQEATVDTPGALLRLWLQTLGESMHAATQSDDGVEATAQMVRATTERQLRTQNLLGYAAEALGLPTRRDLDEAYREIQLLKRQMRK